MEWVTTSTLLEGLRDFGNQNAWNRFEERFRKPLISFARKMALDASEAEDVAQETLIAFAATYRGGAYDRKKGRLSNWLFGIAYRQILNRRRGIARREGKVRATPDTVFWAGLPEEGAAEADWDREWAQARLHQSLDIVRQEVKPATFRAFQALVLENRSPEEVAEELGMSQNGVSVAKHRVLKRLRELGRQWEELD